MEHSERFKSDGVRSLRKTQQKAQHQAKNILARLSRKHA